MAARAAVSCMEMYPELYHDDEPRISPFPDKDPCKLGRSPTKLIMTYAQSYVVAAFERLLGRDTFSILKWGNLEPQRRKLLTQLTPFLCDGM